MTNRFKKQEIPARGPESDSNQVGSSRIYGMTSREVPVFDDVWMMGGSRLRGNDKSGGIYREIPASAGIGLAYLVPFTNQSPARSFQSGLCFSINLFFHDRCQVFNYFSLVIAKFTSVNFSYHTSLVQLYLLVNP